MRNTNILYERKHPNAQEGGDGWQKVYKFENGFGASVVWFKTMFGTMGSYTNEGEWELAVIYFKEDGSYDLVYDTEITSDVIGHLSEEDVDNVLKKIEELEKEVLKDSEAGK